MANTTANTPLPDAPEPSAAPQTAPPERWQHGQEAAPSKAGGQRIKSGVLHLRQVGKIGDAEVMASERWYDDYALAVHGAQASGIGSGSGDLSRDDVRMIASASHRAITEAIGPECDLLLRAFVAGGMSFRQIATAMKRRYEEVGGMVCLALSVLSAQYSLRDRHSLRDRRPRLNDTLTN